MKLRLSKKRNQAMDIMDLLVLIAIIVILATMIILSLKEVHPRNSHHAFSVNQASLSFHILEGGSGDKYPMAVSAPAPPEFRNGTVNVNSACKFP